MEAPVAEHKIPYPPLYVFFNQTKTKPDDEWKRFFPGKLMLRHGCKIPLSSKVNFENLK